jgi:hypothetical protein
MWQPELVLRHLSLLQERHFCFKFGDENKVVPVGFELEFLDIYPYLKIKMLPTGQDSSESCCVCLCVFNILSFSFFFFACIAHSVLILFYQFVCYCYSCIRLLYGAAAQTYFCPFIEDFARWFLRDFLFEFDDLLVFSFGSVILMMTSEFRSPTLILVDYDSDLGPLDL